LAEMIRDNVVISSSNSQSKSDMSNYNIPVNFKFTHKFNNQHLLSVGGSINYTNMSQNSDRDVNDVNNSDLNTVTLVDIDSKNPTLNANSNLKYSHNFKKLSNMVFDFTAGISYQSADKTQIAYDRVTGEINELYSTDQNNRQKQMNIGVGTTLARNIRFDVSYIRSNLQNEEFDNDVDANFNTIDMSMIFKFWNINANLSKRTQLPQASILSNKLNVGNPYYLIVGNANLEPIKLYNLSLSKLVRIKKDIVSLSVNAKYYTDNIVYRRRYFAESTILPEYDNYVVNSGASLVMPFNGSDKWELGGSISANKNVLKVGSFRNVFTYNYKRDAEEVDTKMEYSNRHHVSHKFEYTSNFSYVFRVSLNNRFSYMYSKRPRNISESGLSNEMSIYAVGDLFDRFRIETAYLMNYYNTPFANRESHTLNARIGMRIFKNRMGIISLNAMDILGNNDQWQTMQTSLGIVSQMSQCLSNYYSISFAYRFNNKK
ncbi:MAG: outer membrane beta-barrel protein, partial [Rikenellaceae bacterium]|nr:outer membrane beta-barrel protein [Rikenellaceae bacterium]